MLGDEHFGTEEDRTEIAATANMEACYSKNPSGSKAAET
jgi:hypothetical protein